MAVDAGGDCPLCGSSAGGAGCVREGRLYHRCGTCGLTFMDPADRLDPAEERARYETHDNRPDDPRYRAFLDRLCAPLVARLSSRARGLDYGSGPGPTLSLMLAERGHPTRNYDPFFAADPDALEDAYDFITCSETAEHFHAPAAEFSTLDALLRPGGWLGVMTQPRTTDVDFGTWWYARDPTHVCFYAPETFEWIAERFGWTVERPGPSVALFRKRSA